MRQPPVIAGPPAGRREPDVPARALVRRLAAQLEATVGPLIAPGERCALLDFPVQANVGDSAIWLGERALLRRLGATVAYVADRRGYSAAALARRVGRGPVLLHGGGNLGDVWEDAQAFRERVIADFPDNPIIQLAQWVHFERAANAARARAVLDGHPHLTLLVRDLRSLEAARAEFRTPALLCPDMAFALGPLPRGKAGTAVLWLRRTDKESAGEWPLPVAGEVTDWLGDSRGPLGTLERFLRRQVLHPSSLARPPFRSALYDRLAASRLRHGLRLLSRGDAVVTDRLHGHILCVLMGIPHRFVDTRYGKLSSFYETWTADCPLARPVSAVDEPQPGAASV